MQNVSPVRFQDDDENDNFADIDRLFSKLEHFDPPADMVSRIMGAVNKLPPYPLMEKLLREQSFPLEEGMIVRHDDKDPS
ncbi:hypothetical protein [Dictyobacter aurantiacus]|uniref:Uncharacterized protein n=1 Tax=Dictyobacter aurantiacus TaxID=1936993 RepID=A0A401ZJI3_9CHLR|nr:hypothetical protein [Dictyobacter aurantiacus]GCE07003.1 hypothetical protein KDAU_43320 [Dictyobacter aurantiacus]